MTWKMALTTSVSIFFPVVTWSTWSTRMLLFFSTLVPKTCRSRWTVLIIRWFVWDVLCTFEVRCVVVRLKCLPPLTVCAADTLLETMTSFILLGSVGNITDEMSARIEKAHCALANIRHLWLRKDYANNLMNGLQYICAFSPSEWDDDLAPLSGKCIQHIVFQSLLSLSICI